MKIIAAAVLLLLTGCAQTPPAPAPSLTSLPTVSLEATCHLLYGADFDGPLNDASSIILRLAADPDGSTITLEEVNTTITDIKGARKSADPDLWPYIDAQAAPLETLSSILTTGNNEDLNFDDFKASGYELLSRCT